MGREPVGFATPVMQHRCGADHQRRFGILWVLFAQPGQPRESLERFAQPHVVGENTAQFYAGKMAEKIEAVFLIWPHLSLHRSGQKSRGNAVKIRNPAAEFFGLGLVSKTLKRR